MGDWSLSRDWQLLLLDMWSIKNEQRSNHSQYSLQQPKTVDLWSSTTFEPSRSPLSSPLSQSLCNSMSCDDCTNSKQTTSVRHLSLSRRGWWWWSNKIFHYWSTLSPQKSSSFFGVLPLLFLFVDFPRATPVTKEVTQEEEEVKRRRMRGQIEHTSAALCLAAQRSALSPPPMLPPFFLVITFCRHLLQSLSYQIVPMIGAVQATSRGERE